MDDIFVAIVSSKQKKEIYYQSNDRVNLLPSLSGRSTFVGQIEEKPELELIKEDEK